MALITGARWCVQRLWRERASAQRSRKPVFPAINGFGQVVGYNIFYNTPTTVFRAFLYSGGSMMDIHSPSLFPSGTI